MAPRLKNIDRDTPMLLPPDLRDWIPENHIVHFVLDAVNRLPEERFSFKKPRGREPRPPSRTPPDNKQYNFTDPESRIMKDGGDYSEGMIEKVEANDGPTVYAAVEKQHLCIKSA